VRAFAWLEDTRPSILEELIAPLQDCSGRMAGTLWIAHHDARSRCSADDAQHPGAARTPDRTGIAAARRRKDREHALSVFQSLQVAQQALLSHDLAQERTQREQAEAAEHERSAP
jgi:hypothetical protein